MPPCIQSEFCLCDFVPLCEKKLRGQHLLLYFHAFRFVQNMRLPGSLNDDNSAPSQGSGYEINRFGEKQTYGFRIRGKDCMETYGKSRVGAFISGLFRPCPFMPGRYDFSHGTAKMLKKKTFSPQFLGDGPRFLTKLSVLYYWNWLSSFLLLC